MTAPSRLVDRYDVALLDLDGVVYVGPDAVPGAPEHLAAARAAGMHLAFVTNNASRPPAVVAAHLTELGIAARPDEVVTSAQAAARTLAELVPPGSQVLVVGGAGLIEALEERGLVPTRSAQGAAAAVQGFDPSVDWAQLAEAAFLLGGDPDAVWVASNADLTLPTPRGRAPGNGALVAAVRAATGREPIVTGKPEPPMHRESIIRTGSQRPLVVGDRLDTDILGANRAGVDSLLVLTGVTDPEHAVLAEPDERATFVSSDLGGLLDPPERVQGEFGRGLHGAGVDTWEAMATSAGLTWVARGQPPVPPSINALRAACAAVWSLPAQERPSPEMVRVGLREVGW